MEPENRKRRTKVVLDAHEGLLAGVDLVAEAVGSTLGPQGRTVLIYDGDGAPIITKDGVTVSRAIRLKEPLAQMGSSLIQAAASRTNEVAGDGTTTATVLAQALIRGSHRRLRAGYSASALAEGVAWARDFLVEELRKQAQPVKDGDLKRVATISANNDAEMGELIALAMEKVGRDGIVTVEDARGTHTTLEVVEGMQFERGYLSPYFVTDNDRMHTLFEDARVLVVEDKLDSVQGVVPILEKAMQQRAGLIIIGEVEAEVLQTLVLNRVKGNLPVVAVKPPGFGDHRGELLRDICVLTGARLVSAQAGLKLQDAKAEHLGRCKRVIVTVKSTTLVGSGSAAASVSQHVSALREQLQDVSLDVDGVVKLQNRIARLSGGVAIIKVGGVTELEMGERKYRIEDALNATRAAAQEGIVTGGGDALMHAHVVLDDAIAPNHYEKTKAGNPIVGDVLEGVKIVSEACLAPISRIVSNAGKVPEVITNRCCSGHGGYDARSGKFVDLLKAGIVDPVKVTRTALENAASVALTFLSLSAVIHEEEG